MSADIGGLIMGKTTPGTDLQAGLNRSRRRARRLVGTAAVLAAASPFTLAARPAGAVVNEASATGSLTFVTHAGTTVTCVLDGNSSRNTEGTRQGRAGNLTQLPNGTFSPNCRGEQYIIATFKDSQGVTRTVSSYAFATDETLATWEGAFSAVKVTHRVFFGECNGEQSATCELSVNTAPK
jgi:hypothetical protein